MVGGTVGATVGIMAVAGVAVATGAHETKIIATSKNENMLFVFIDTYLEEISHLERSL
jgi:hypothetical protein